MSLRTWWERWTARGEQSRDVAFLQAVERADWQTALRYLKRGADVNARTLVGLTALHLAAANGDIGLVGVLMRHGADLNVQGFGGTPLHMATDAGHYAVVRALLLHGADPFALDPDDRMALTRTDDPAIQGELRAEMARIRRQLRTRRDHVDEQAGEGS